MIRSVEKGGGKGHAMSWPTELKPRRAGCGRGPSPNFHVNFHSILCYLRYHRHLPLEDESPPFLFHIYFYTVILPRFWDILTDMLTVVIVPNAYWHVKHVLMSLLASFSPVLRVISFFFPSAFYRRLISFHPIQWSSAGGEKPLSRQGSKSGVVRLREEKYVSDLIPSPRTFAQVIRWPLFLLQ